MFYWSWIESVFRCLVKHDLWPTNDVSVGLWGELCSRREQLQRQSQRLRVWKDLGPFFCRLAEDTWIRSSYARFCFQPFWALANHVWDLQSSSVVCQNHQRGWKCVLRFCGLFPWESRSISSVQDGHALIIASDGLWDAFSDDDAGEERFVFFLTLILSDTPVGKLNFPSIIGKSDAWCY